MHKRLAAKSLVGKGRSEPNQNPVLDEPAGRLQFNPLRPDVMLKKLLGPVTRFSRSTACEQMFGTGIVADEDRVTRDVTPPTHTLRPHRSHQAHAMRQSTQHRLLCHAGVLLLVHVPARPL